MSEFSKVNEEIHWLKTPIQYLKGIGPGLAKVYSKINIVTFEDLLYHLPSRYLDRTNLVPLNQISPGTKVCVVGEVEVAGEVRLGGKGRKAYEVIFTDGHGYLNAIWFHYARSYFQNRFKLGEKFLLFGEVGSYRGDLRIIHPEVTPLGEFFEEGDLSQVLTFVPVYPATEGLRQPTIRKNLKQLLGDAEEKLADPLPELMRKKRQLAAMLDSFKGIHQPAKDADLNALQFRKTDFHRRLIFCEFFFLEIGLELRRRRAQISPGIHHQPLQTLRQKMLESLPFELTEGQKRAVGEISRDMCSARPMNRLLQGDVGSGKTLVCLIAALTAVENGFQAVLMAPTEILAEQHRHTFRQLAAPLGVDVQLLTAAVKGKARKAVLEQIRSGVPSVLIGTHALLEAEVQFENLSLVIIDEQHRFGVRQRFSLMRKGGDPDVLVLTATPIPRSLAMTLYGDLDLSLMPEMPRGRQPIWTKVMPERERPKLYEFIRKKLLEGRQAYFVFPLIEESEKLDLRDATKAFEKLKGIFPEFSLAMLHGRMKNEEKEAVMARFSQGEIQALVATTVIEVGIDVPNATIMVVEHAERFGLSQLHQLRGRVGRGSEKSYCILAADYQKSETAKERLRVMETTVDGFKIAEEDLQIRGPGDFLGTRQSGMPDLRVASLVSDLDLLEQAKLAAIDVLRDDPELEAPEHQAMKLILEHRWQGRLGLAKVG